MTVHEPIKAEVSFNPSCFEWVYNMCLSFGKFPTNWKKDRLVIIQKPGKSLDSPSAYRPISLLDNCGKHLEKLIVERLRGQLIDDHAIADNQHGFRRGRSTLDVLVI